ncbi:MAG: FIST N-terminal domain-containing protein [Burkholderiaceae bacterium]
MPTFRQGHASHPDWRTAAQLVLTQLGGSTRREPPPSNAALGLLYVTEPFSAHLGDIAALLAKRLPGVRWVGAGAHGICVPGAEYVDEPALAAMVCELPGDSWRIFSGLQPLPAAANDAGQDDSSPPAAALVHADPATPELAELVSELAARTGTGMLFGGLIGDGDGSSAQLADEAVDGGLSGVAFSGGVRLLSRLTQGCAPLAREHRISDCSAHYIRELDGRPALDVLLEDLDVPAAVRHSRDGDEILRALPTERLARGLMVGFAPGLSDKGIGFGDYTVRNLVGIDPHNRLLAVAARPQYGDRAVFCTRDQRAARADLIRICTELREELETESLRVLGAHYVSCVARGEHLFGAPGAEVEIVSHNLGDIPLIGFFANGEIAGERLYGYTGILTLFVAKAPAANG